MLVPLSVGVGDIDGVCVSELVFEGVSVFEVDVVLDIDDVGLTVGVTLDEAPGVIDGVSDCESEDVSVVVVLLVDVGISVPVFVQVPELVIVGEFVSLCDTLGV